MAKPLLALHGLRRLLGTGAGAAGGGSAPVFSNMAMTDGVAGISDGELSGEVDMACTAYYVWDASATPISGATAKADAITDSQTISLTSGVVTGSLLNTPATSGTHYLHIVGEASGNLGATTVAVAYVVQAAPWYPSELFAGSEKGAWWDFTDKAYIFTDTARTTAVTADGDAIKGVEDRSGNGNHISEGTNWPLYEDTSGIARAQFDGSNDIFARTNDAAFQFASVTLAVGMVARTIAATDKFGLGAYVTTGNQRAFQLVAKGSGTTGGLSWTTSTNGTANTSIGVGSSVTDATVVAQADPGSPGLSEIWLNGTASGASTGLATFYGATSTAPFQIGGSTSGGTYLQASLTHIVVIDRALTTDERQKLEGFIAWESGLEASLPGGHPYLSAPPTV